MRPATKATIILLAIRLVPSAVALSQSLEIGGTTVTLRITKPAAAELFLGYRLLRLPSSSGKPDDMWLIGTNGEHSKEVGTLLFENGRLCEASILWNSGSAREALDSAISILSKNTGLASTYSWHAEAPDFSLRCSRVNLTGKGFMQMCTSTGEFKNVEVHEGIGECGKAAKRH